MPERRDARQGGCGKRLTLRVTVGAPPVCRVQELVSTLRENNINVRFGIHPVAG